MKKRLLLYFLCALTLFILMISIDNDFIYHTCQYANICEMDDITCYEETSASNGLPDFDPELVPEGLEKTLSKYPKQRNRAASKWVRQDPSSAPALLFYVEKIQA
ncbi:hypothetical protein WN48_10908 [Eufriesea mexicana]|uniref:Uncharacterized protein n=1 Tax=Eufriesea mexicana TaxID=516756 RepID=A0A310SDJ8_9HYME|nr:hypothetical protein WN48_10908 [Eufriesea mexicana]